ncbi:MAG: ester cyclase [Dehalococcoidia bacterium]
MTSDVPRERVWRLVCEFVAAWNRHDAARLASLFAEGASYGEFGLGTIMLGREEILRYLSATFAALPDLTIAPTSEPLSSGERVYWKWLMTATHRGQFAGLLPSGKRFLLLGCSVLVVRGDEIMRAADCFDVAAVLRQLTADGERRCNSARTALDPRMAMLADEDNIGYGE